MPRLLSISHAIGAAVFGLAALGTTSAVQARGDVSVSIGIHVPGVRVHPAPVHVYPQPVYVHPQPYHVRPQPVYVHPQPVYVQPRPVFVPAQPVYLQPRPVIVYQPVYGHHYRKGPRWQHDEWERGHRHGPRGPRHWRGHDRDDDRD